jgi:pentatricopeptide repeat protein
MRKLARPLCIVIRSSNIRKIIPTAQFSINNTFYATKTAEAQTVKTMKHLAEKGQIEDIEALFQKSDKSQASYNAMADAYIKQGDLEKAREIIQQMRSAHMEPSTSTIASLINETEDLEEAKTLFESIGKDSKTYGAIIKAHVNANKLEEAMKYLEEAFQHDVKLSAKTVTDLIRTLVNRGVAAQADRVLRLVAANGIEPETAAYNAVLLGYCNENDVKDAARLFDVMGPEKNRDSYCIMLRVYAKAGDLKNAEKTIAGAFKKYKSDIIILNQILGEYVAEGLLENAEQLLNSVESNYGVKPDQHCYNMVINGYRNAGKLEQAIALEAKIAEKQAQIPQPNK